jgi:hypothetical protein
MVAGGFNPRRNLIYHIKCATSSVPAREVRSLVAWMKGNEIQVHAPGFLDSTLFHPGYVTTVLAFVICIHLYWQNLSRPPSRQEGSVVSLDLRR